MGSMIANDVIRDFVGLFFDRDLWDLELDYHDLISKLFLRLDLCAQ